MTETKPLNPGDPVMISQPEACWFNGSLIHGCGDYHGWVGIIESLVDYRVCVRFEVHRYEPGESGRIDLEAVTIGFPVKEVVRYDGRGVVDRAVEP